jgi:N-acetylglucosamine-6-phosphate deacetylase
VLTLDRALANAVAHGVDVVAASRLLSGNPARYLGLSDRGALVAGLRADMVVLDAALAVEQVWIAGRRIV